MRWMAWCGCVAVLLLPSVAAALPVNFESMSPTAQRAALRQAHRQTVLIAGPNQKLYQHWLDRLALPTAQGTVRVQSDGRNGDAGGSMQQTDGIAQYQLGMGKKAGPSTLAHELGHAFDDSVLTDADRNRIMAILHIQNTPWGEEGASTSGEPNPPREKFAELYRIEATHPKQLSSAAHYATYLTRQRELGYLKHMPSYKQMRKVAAVIQAAAAR